MSKPVAVLLSFPLVIGRAGIGTIAHAQASELHHAGAAVTVVAAGAEPGTSLPDGVRVRYSLQVGDRRVPHRALGSVDRALAWHDLVTGQIVRRSAARLDVVHGWPGAGRRTFAAARAVGVASVREAPNTHTENAYAVMEREMARLGLPTTAGHSHSGNPGRLARELQEYELATALLCPADSVAQSFRDRGFDPRRLLATRYGFDPAAGFRPGPVRVDGAPLRLVFVGRCEPRKGLHFALEAWIASGLGGSGATFDIFGSFYPGYAEILGDRLTAPGVTVRGFTDDVPAELARADALVLPSLEEGSALVTYEAQAAGCALVVSDQTGAVCQPGVQGLIHPAADVAALTRDLRSLAADRGRLEAMRAAAAQQSETLSWADAAQLLLERYEDAKALSRR